MSAYVTNIENDALREYRLPPRSLRQPEHPAQFPDDATTGEEICLEKHEGNDQFIRVESGTGIALLDGKQHALSDGVALVIPSGTEHNVINTSKTTPLRLYTLYSPPEHPVGTVHRTKADDPDIKTAVGRRPVNAAPLSETAAASGCARSRDSPILFGIRPA